MYVLTWPGAFAWVLEASWGNSENTASHFLQTSFFSILLGISRQVP